MQVALLVSLVVVVASSRELTSAQGPVNYNSASTTSFDIIESPDQLVAFPTVVAMYFFWEGCLGGVIVAEYLPRSAL